MQNGVHYIDSSRRLHTGRGREDVHHRRAGDCIWGISTRSLWIDLLDYNFLLAKRGLLIGKPFLLVTSFARSKSSRFCFGLRNLLRIFHIATSGVGMILCATISGNPYHSFVIVVGICFSACCAFSVGKIVSGR